MDLGNPMARHAMNPHAEFETIWRHWPGDNPKDLLERKLHYRPVPEPQALAKNQANLIADAVETAAAPIE